LGLNTGGDRFEEQLCFEPLPQDEHARRCPDITKARTLLGWEPQVQLREGLETPTISSRARPRYATRAAERLKGLGSEIFIRGFE
jgi:hypothetical protein